MEELKIWLETFIRYTEKKIDNIKRIAPDHRNIKRFEGEVSMAKKTIVKIDALTKTPIVKPFEEILSDAIKHRYDEIIDNVDPPL